MLDDAYAWLDGEIAKSEWGGGIIVQPRRLCGRPVAVLCRLGSSDPGGIGNSRAYRARLLARPSFARAVDEARPYRGYFPLGAPDRD